MPSIRSSRVVVEGNLRPARVRFDDGVITEITPGGAADRDLGDLVVMPGLVDTHVHVNDPGRTHWEGFRSATRAAAAGGTTTIVDMPLNSIPPTTSVEALEAKREAASGRLAVDVAFWGGLVPGSASEISSLVDEGVCGFKAFMVDSGVPEFPPVSPVELREGLFEMATFSVPGLVHAEDPRMLGDPVGDTRQYQSYLESRPVESERKAIESVAELAGGTGASVHILHVSSGDAVTAIFNAGDFMSGETCPHYLTFAAEEIDEGATPFKCAPPIRPAEHREALWEGLEAGSLAMVVSDHSPAPTELKEVESGDFRLAWGGISSLQLRLSATWTGARARGLSIPVLSQWLAAAPAELAGLDDRKGAIEVGRDADLLVWDPDVPARVRGADLEHRHPVTPYEAMSLRGRVVSTLLRGNEVYAGGTFLGLHGRMLRRR